MISIPLSQLPCPGCYEIESQNPATPGAFVVYHPGGISAFLNQCPHTGAPLNWQPDQFLDLEQKHILCSLHGALFRSDDGFCISGPCQGQSLSEVPVSIDKDQIRVEYDPGV